MQINNSTQRGNKIDPISGLMNSATQVSKTDAAGFASLLRQSQARPQSQAQAQAKAQTQAKPLEQSPSHAPAPAPAPARPSEQASKAQDQREPDHDANTDRSDATKKVTAHDGDTSSDSASSRAIAAGKAKLRNADEAANAKRAAMTKDAAATNAKAAEAQSSDETSTAKTVAATENGAATAQPTMDPTIMQWLAGQQRGGATDTVASTKAGKDGKTGEAEGSNSLDGSADTRGSAMLLRGAALKADADPRADVGQDLLSDAASAGRFAAALAETGVTEKVQVLSSDPTNGVKDIGAVAGGAFVHEPAPPASRDTAAVTTVALPTPVDSPDFAQTLGVQMSVFARDGVQQAELHLNPADMGPVSVQIEMNGTQAHVAFGADHAGTRQAIEAGMPELASALRDAGFTLAGGGVSQHSGSRDQSGNNGDGNGDAANGRGQRTVNSLSSSDKAVASVSAAARRIVTAGGVDLFA